MTGLTSNINDVIERFKKIQTDAKNIDFSEALAVGVNAARGEMSNRIFNQGKDSKGTPLGPYKGRKKKANPKFKSEAVKKFLVGNLTDFSPYMMKRINAGRQVNYKDLEFTGDLRRGIKTVKKNNEYVVCAIVNDKLILIAEGQEQQLKTTIVSLSESERETLKLNVNAALKQLYARIINS